MKILLIEPWLAGSHQQWAEGYAGASQHQISVLGLPGELWRWRLQGGAAPLASRVSEHISTHGPPDLLLVSGLVDGSQLLGLTRRFLPADTPMAVYQHESQLVYPTGTADRSALMANWMSWVAADVVFFNSDFHRHAVLEALPPFLAGLPDQSHVEFLAATIDRFEVMPVGLDLSWVPDDQTRFRPHRAAPIVLWPHRWEEDKDPDAFDRALAKLDETGLDYQLILAGDDGQSGPSRRESLADGRPGRILACGPFSMPDYRSLLQRADLVVSCARHEFFGVGVAEAVAAGARPVVPRALAYPEVLGPTLRGYETGRFGSALIEAVFEWHSPASTDCVAVDRAMVDHVRRLDWRIVAPRFDQRLTDLAVASVR